MHENFLYDPTNTKLVHSTSSLGKNFVYVNCLTKVLLKALRTFVRPYKQLSKNKKFCSAVFRKVLTKKRRKNVWFLKIVVTNVKKLYDVLKETKF